MNKYIFSSVFEAEDYSEYIACVQDILGHRAVQSMRHYTQHRGTSILEHSLCVSYLSYRVCKLRGYDYRSAARGGLLHDFFLYQRHVNKPYKGWHTTGHPRLALKNASDRYDLNNIEKDIIIKHMWPISSGFPRFKESYVVSMVDKFCSVIEFFKLLKGDTLKTITADFAPSTA